MCLPLRIGWIWIFLNVALHVGVKFNSKLQVVFAGTFHLNLRKDLVVKDYNLLWIGAKPVDMGY